MTEERPLKTSLHCIDCRQLTSTTLVDYRCIQCWKKRAEKFERRADQHCDLLAAEFENYEPLREIRRLRADKEVST